MYVLYLRGGGGQLCEMSARKVEDKRNRAAEDRKAFQVNSVLNILLTPNNNYVFIYQFFGTQLRIYRKKMLL